MRRMHDDDQPHGQVVRDATSREETQTENTRERRTREEFSSKARTRLPASLRLFKEGNSSESRGIVSKPRRSRGSMMSSN